MYQIFILKKLTKKLAFVKISLYICSMKNRWLDFKEWKFYTKWREDNEYLPMNVTFLGKEFGELMAKLMSKGSDDESKKSKT